MTTKDVVEALLFLNPESRPILTAAHILSEKNNWQAKEHPELTFMRYFKDPRYLWIIESQIHVYIIGDPVAKNMYNILNIEGYDVDHLLISKQQLREEIKSAVSEPRFLPDPGFKRFIFSNGKMLYIFNRFDEKKFVARSKWTIGTNIYDAGAPEYDISINNLFREIEDEFKKYSG